MSMVETVTDVREYPGWSSINLYFSPTDIDAMNSILSEQKRGTPTLLKNLRLAIYHMVQAQQDVQKVKKTAYFKPTGPGKMDTEAKVERSAVRAWRKLLGVYNTPRLRAQAEVLNIDYEAYETQEEVIEAILTAMFPAEAGE
jgi:hypothetical protein